MNPGEERSLRRTARPWTLIRTAIGGPREIAGKLLRLGRTCRLYARPSEIAARLDALERRGLVSGRPSRGQIAFGGLDMLRFVIEPAARDYYRQIGISFGFHQLLRVLDDPVSMIDPTGFLSERDTIVGHLMQVVHLNPVYDLQLLQMFDDGLEDLEAQLVAMVDGTHPRHGTIGAIVEDPEYHARLLGYVRRYRSDPETPPPVREAQTLREDPRFAAAERTFATLPGFVRYCETLPQSLPALLGRLRRVRAFPIDGATGSEPERSRRSTSRPFHATTLGYPGAMPIRAVVFDLFDTLVDLRFEDVERVEVNGRRVPASARVLHAAVAEHAPVTFEEFVATSLALDERFRKTHYEQNRELPTLERFEALAAQLGLDGRALPERLTRLHMEQIRRHVRVPVHHAEVLRALGPRAVLGVCSNFSHAETALGILDEAQLLERFGAVVISETVGVRKPAAGIFETVLRKLEVAPEETLHVGDSLRADVGGAAACGIRTAWLTRRVDDAATKLTRHAGPGPDWVIDDLAEILERLPD